MPCLQQAAAERTVQGCQAAMFSRVLQMVGPSRWAAACAACTSLLLKISRCRIYPATAYFSMPHNEQHALCALVQH